MTPRLVALWCGSDLFVFFQCSHTDCLQVTALYYERCTMSGNVDGDVNDAQPIKRKEWDHSNREAVKAKRAKEPELDEKIKQQQRERKAQWRSKRRGKKVK